MYQQITHGGNHEHIGALGIADADDDDDCTFAALHIKVKFLVAPQAKEPIQYNIHQYTEHDTIHERNGELCVSVDDPLLQLCQLRSTFKLITS